MPLTIDQYTAQFSSPLPPLHEELLQFTFQQHPHAHMVSGHVQGQFLRFISRLARPKRILEIGTFTGFSALCLADGLAQDGLLYTLELREADATLAKTYFDRSPWSSRIQLLTGNALEIVPTLNETWDLIFIDADKTSYIDYYEMVIPQMAEHGLILADNVFFHGAVLDDEVKGKNAKAMAAFNDHVHRDPRTEQVMVSMRDGITMIRKKPAGEY